LHNNYRDTIGPVALEGSKSKNLIIRGGRGTVPTGRLLAFNDSVYLAFNERLISKRFDIMRQSLFGVYQRLLVFKIKIYVPTDI